MLMKIQEKLFGIMIIYLSILKCFNYRDVYATKKLDTNNNKLFDVKIYLMTRIVRIIKRKQR